MARRALKLASFATVAAATTGLYLHSTRLLDINDFGIVRIGRTVATVSFNAAACGREVMKDFLD